MGSCASCLGLKGWNNDDERSRLISTEEQGYGSHLNRSHANDSGYYSGHPQMVDPNDSAREREQLDRIVAQTSETLIDIFSLQAAPGQYSDNSRAETYKLLLQRTPPPEVTPMPQKLPLDSISSDEREMMERIGKMAEEAVSGMRQIKGVGCLVVNLNVEN